MSNSNNKKRKFENETPLCVCGTKLEYVTQRQAYPELAHTHSTIMVSCNLCNLPQSNIRFYHCPNGRTTHHEHGYDLCETCTLVEPPNKKKKLHTESSVLSESASSSELSSGSESTPGSESSSYDSEIDSSNETPEPVAICFCGGEPVRPIPNTAHPASMVWRCARCHPVSNAKSNRNFIVMLKSKMGDGYSVEETTVKVKEVWNNQDNANKSALEIFQKESCAEEICLKTSYKNGLFNETDEGEHYGSHYQWTHVWVECHIVR
eukprot:184184_1